MGLESVHFLNEPIILLAELSAAELNSSTPVCPFQGTFIAMGDSLVDDKNPSHRMFCAELEDKSLNIQETEGKKISEDTSEQLIARVQASVIGQGHIFDTPFGEKRLVYADWTASGRGLSFVERHIQEDVLPFYGNTHTTTSITGLQSTCYRHEARQIIAQAVNANSKQDVVLFAGSGTTGAINLLVHVLGLLGRLYAVQYLPNPQAQKGGDHEK
mgnify:CR=1 FL=1